MIGKMLAAIASAICNCGRYRLVGSECESDLAESGRDPSRMCEQITEFNGRLEGLVRLLNDRKQIVKDRMQDVHCEMTSLSNRLTDDELHDDDEFDENTLQVELQTLMRKKMQMEKIFRMINKLDCNVSSMKMNVDTHGLMNTLKQTLLNLPHGVDDDYKKTLTMTTMYNDRIDEMARELQLPLDTEMIVSELDDGDVKNRVTDLLRNSSRRTNCRTPAGRYGVANEPVLTGE